MFNELAGKDELRPAMSHVLVTRKDIVATDAHVMGWCDTKAFFNSDFIDGLPSKGILIHHEDWKKMLAVEYSDTIHWKSTGVIRFTPKGKRPSIIEVDINGEDNTYPNWEAVVPQKVRRQEMGAIGLNPVLLHQLHKFFKPILDNDGVRMTFNGSSAILVSPRSCQIGAESVEGLVMPVML
jgi:hypothetical protein